MSILTSRFRLIKPALSDTADITAFGSNWDTIDANLGYADQFRAIVITSGQNVNNLTTPAVYQCKTNAIASSLSNSPTNNAFNMVVLPHADGGVTQFITECMTSDSKQFRRNKYNGSWGSWLDLSGANMELKRVVGDGTFGSNHPKSISFSFAPAVIILLLVTTEVGYVAQYGSRLIKYMGTEPTGIVTPSQLALNYSSYLHYSHTNPILICSPRAISTSYTRGFFIANSVCIYTGNRGNTPNTYAKRSADGKTFTFYAERNGASETIFPDRCIANLQLNENNSTYMLLALGNNSIYA